MVQKKVKIIKEEYLGKKHPKSHDPKITDVLRILKEIEICKCTGRDVFIRNGKKITYKLYKNEEPCTWIVVGLTTKKKVRGHFPRYNGLKMIVSCEDILKACTSFERSRLSLLT